MQATATGWICECGRGNVSLACPRCGTKRPADAPSTPASALPRNVWQPTPPTSPAPPQRATRTFGPVVAPVAAAPAKGTFWTDLRFALATPFSGMGLIVMAVGVIFAFALIGATQAFVFAFPAVFVLGGAAYWFYNNYWFQTIRTASTGGAELPDSPMGYEAMGVFQLLWLSILTYVALALPNIVVSVLAAFEVPFVVSHPTLFYALANIWPGVAGPMTILLVTLTHNPTTAFNYPAIAASIVRSFKRYFHVLDLFWLMSVLPQVLLVLTIAKLGTSVGALLLLVGAQAALAMYSMMALGLYLGRFYWREQKTLGWFSA